MKEGDVWQIRLLYLCSNDSGQILKITNGNEGSSESQNPWQPTKRETKEKLREIF